MHDAHSFNAATRALMLAYGRPARAVSARATPDFLRAGRREGVPDGWPSERRCLSTHAHFFEAEREQFSRRRRKGAGKAPRSPALCELSEPESSDSFFADGSADDSKEQGRRRAAAGDRLQGAARDRCVSEAVE